MNEVIKHPTDREAERARIEYLEKHHPKREISEKQKQKQKQKHKT
jgi:hypothetical protein